MHESVYIIIPLLCEDTIEKKYYTCTFKLWARLSYQLCRHSRICICWQYSSCIYSNFSLSFLSPIAGWYMQKWHWLKLSLCRSVWGSLLFRSRLFLSSNHYERYIEDLSISWGLKQTTGSRWNSARNAHSRMLEKVDMKVGQWTFCLWLKDTIAWKREYWIVECYTQLMSTMLYNNNNDDNDDDNDSNNDKIIRKRQCNSIK